MLLDAEGRTIVGRQGIGSSGAVLDRVEPHHLAIGTGTWVTEILGTEQLKVAQCNVSVI